MTYVPHDYWTERGAGPDTDQRSPAHRVQERHLRALLAGLEFGTVLDAGCGSGRISGIVAALWPEARILGIDLSPDRIERAREAVPTGEFVATTIQAFRTRQRFDLVLAVELLMHVPPADVAEIAAKLRRLSARYLVTVDWTPDALPPVVAAHNFAHDYAAILGPIARSEPVGRQTIHLVEVAP